MKVKAGIHAVQCFPNYFARGPVLASKHNHGPSYPCSRKYNVRIFFMSRQPPMGLDLLIIEASRSNSDTPHSVGHLWTSDQSSAQTCTWQHTTLTRDIHAPAGFETATLASERSQPHALHRATTGMASGL